MYNYCIKIIMSNSKITIYNDDNNQNTIVENNNNNTSEPKSNILSTLDSETLARCKRIYKKALFWARQIAIHHDISIDENNKIISTDTDLLEKPVKYLRNQENGKLDINFNTNSNSNKSKPKKNILYEAQQSVTDQLVHHLEIIKNTIEKYFRKERLGEPEREIINEILEEEAEHYATTEDINPILQSYLTFIKQKIESINQTSLDADRRKFIHQAIAKKRHEERVEEEIAALFLSWTGKPPTLEGCGSFEVKKSNG